MQNTKLIYYTKFIWGFYKRLLIKECALINHTVYNCFRCLNVTFSNETYEIDNAKYSGLVTYTTINNSRITVTLLCMQSLVNPYNVRWSHFVCPENSFIGKIKINFSAEKYAGNLKVLTACPTGGSLLFHKIRLSCYEYVVRFY